MNLNLDFASFNNCFSGNINHIKEECKRAFKIKEIQSKEQYSTGSTYFVRATESNSNLHILEKLAMEIFQYHTQNINYDPSNSGCEWWVQYINFEDEIGFHFDKDYGLEEENIHKYPNLATVSYFTSIGASTVIVDKRGANNSNNINVNKRKKGNVITNCLGNASYVISKPIEGKHIKFDGRLLHGAPTNVDSDTECSSDNSSSDESSSSNDVNEDDESLSPKRITFLVNIWIDHIPSQATKFSIEHNNISNNYNNIASFCPTTLNQKIYKLCDNSDCEYRSHKFRYNNDLLEIEYSVPKDNDLKVIENDFDVIHVPTEDYCCVKKIGEFVESDDCNSIDEQLNRKNHKH